MKNVVLLLGAVSIVYLGHFQNAFHFDDFHTVVKNPYIRDLRFLPKYFSDSQTFSTLPRNRAYRPIVTASLALDYRLGNGLKPFWFHFGTFLSFLVQLVLMYVLSRRIFDHASPDPGNHWAALFATSWYGLHPAMAETVNYVIQRADLYSTLGVIAGLVLYETRPELRRFGLYLIPVAVALLSKPPAMVFPALLFVYLWLFEENTGPGKLRRVTLAVAPALALTGAAAWLIATMTPKSFTVGNVSTYAYRITQPLVALRYFRTFLSPGSLTADTDLAPVSSILKDGAWMGLVFVAVLIAIAWLCARKREWGPVSFGIWWFLIALLPTSIFPLSEVENDHRMFFPFVGLVLAGTWPAVLGIRCLRPRAVVRVGVPIFCVLELAILALGTMQRNVVWRTDESLWRDVTEKSPKNPRGLLNYAANLAQKSDFVRAREYLERAQSLAPNYALVDVNLGVVLGHLDQPEAAEEHFRRAAGMLASDPTGHYFYGVWLNEVGRQLEAINQFRFALNANPDYLDAIYRLMETYAKRESWVTVQRLADYVLTRFPADDFASTYRLMAAREDPELALPDAFSTPERLVSLSAAYYENGQYRRCIDAARDALKRQPRLPDAFNNMAAAFRSLGDCTQAGEAARQALNFRPDYPAARKNLELCSR